MVRNYTQEEEIKEVMKLKVKKTKAHAILLTATLSGPARPPTSDRSLRERTLASHQALRGTKIKGK